MNPLTTEPPSRAVSMALAAMLSFLFTQTATWAADTVTAKARFEGWQDTNYGPLLFTVVETGPGSYAHRGIATRVDHGDGGFVEGRDYLLFDIDTLRCAAGWRGSGGIDWHGIASADEQFAPPSITGALLFENPAVPGWTAAGDPRLEESRDGGRESDQHASIKKAPGRWIGLYQQENRTVWSYQVLGADVLESPDAGDVDDTPVLLRHFEIGPRPQDMVLQVAHNASAEIELHGETSATVAGQVVTLTSAGDSGDVANQRAQVPRDAGADIDGAGDDPAHEEDDEELLQEELEEDSDEEDEAAEEDAYLEFEGDTSLRVAKKQDFDLTNSDYAIMARIRTQEGGTIFAQAPGEGEHAPNAKSLFVAEGVLQFDIGFVDVVSATTRVDDGDWHVVALTWAHDHGDAHLYVDGTEEARAQMSPTEVVGEEQVLRIGFTTPDFPDEVRGFEGQIAELAFYQRQLDQQEIQHFGQGQRMTKDLVAHWNRFDHEADTFLDATGNGHDATFEDVELFDEEDFEEEFDEDEDEEEQAIRFDGQSVRVALENLRSRRAPRSSYTIAAKIRTEEGGPIFAIAAQSGSWQPNNICWFISDGRLAFDLGYVGQVQGWKNIADGRWHDVAMSYDLDTGQVAFTVDGQDDRVRIVAGEEAALLPADVTDELSETSGWIGYASDEFPEEAPRYFQGRIAQLRIYGGVLSNEEIADVMEMEAGESRGVLAAWEPAYAIDGVVEDLSENGLDGILMAGSTAQSSARTSYGRTACSAIDAPTGSQWQISDDGHVRLLIPAGDKRVRFSLVYAAVVRSEPLESFRTSVLARLTPPPELLSTSANSSERRWTEEVSTSSTTIGPQDAPYMVESIRVPDRHPYGSQLRPSGFDFFAEGDSAAVCTWGGDVWIVDGLGAATTTEHRWRRVAAGLWQPQGLKIVNGQIYVTCRDQIVLLQDLNSDGETDFYKCFHNCVANRTQVTPELEELASGLETDSAGNFYYLRVTQRPDGSAPAPHGALVRVSPDGISSKVVAAGFRAPSGLTVNDDGTFYVSDREGPWIPKNRINHVREGYFYGTENDGGQRARKENGQPPVVWIHGDFDRAPAGLLHVKSDRWGPLEGQLLSLSNSSGRINVLLQRPVAGVRQGGLYGLPLALLPTAVGFGRFHPHDKQLYVCGSFGSSTGQLQSTGGFYRIRYTGRPLTLPLALAAHQDGIAVTFSGPLDPESATDWRNYATARWGYRPTPQIGSEDYRISDRRRRGRDRLLAHDVRLSRDKKSVIVAYSEMLPAEQMDLRFDIKSAAGEALDFRIHQTIHRLGEADSLSSRGAANRNDVVVVGNAMVTKTKPSLRRQTYSSFK